MRIFFFGFNIESNRQSRRDFPKNTPAGKEIAMKVLMLNGSPHKNGCTNRALEEIAAELKKEGVASEIVWIGAKPVGGCAACYACRKLGKCAFDGGVNEFVEKAKEADGFIFGSPVHYASACGNVTSFLDRAFYSGGAAFRGKPGAAIASARRAGTTATLEQLNKYFGITQMPTVGSSYWNMVHGSNAQDVEKDAEGLQTMRVLARNMAWLLKCIEAGKQAGIERSDVQLTEKTNFIR